MRYREKDLRALLVTPAGQEELQELALPFLEGFLRSHRKAQEEKGEPVIASHKLCSRSGVINHRFAMMTFYADLGGANEKELGLAVDPIDSVPTASYLH